MIFLLRLALSFLCCVRSMYESTLFYEQTAFIWLWFTIAIGRELIFPYAIYYYTGILGLMIKLHEYVSNRLIKQMVIIFISNCFIHYI